MAFLAVATGSAIKLHQSRLNFDHAAMQRLTGQIAIENLAEQLRLVDDVELAETADQLARDAGMQIDVDPFDSGSLKGWHVKISMMSESGPLVHHVWRLERDS